MKNASLSIGFSWALAAVIIPVIGFAATATIRPTRSNTYLMGTGGTGVPYYVYGYDVKINTASAAQASLPPPTAPKLPIAGGGGKMLEKPTR